jgi:hypothetical protein
MSPSSLTLLQIEEILRKCDPGMSENVLSRDEAKARAVMVYEDTFDQQSRSPLGQSRLHLRLPPLRNPPPLEWRQRIPKRLFRRRQSLAAAERSEVQA